MADKEYFDRTLWGIHGGKIADADSLYLKRAVKRWRASKTPS